MVTVPSGREVLPAQPGRAGHEGVSQNALARHLALVTPGIAGLRMMRDFGEIDFTDVRAVVETMRRHNTELVS